MNYSANASNVTTAILKIFFGSIFLALILSPVISAGRQEPTQSKTKQRTLRIDRLETPEEAKKSKEKRSETQQRSLDATGGDELAPTTLATCPAVLFLGDVQSVKLTAFNYPPNSTVTFTTRQTNPGIVGFAATEAGPFIADHQFSVTMDGTGSGISNPYFVKGLMLGFTSHYDESGFTGEVFTPVNYNVIPQCNCPPIPVIP
jgi:hypothetical protein